MTERVTITRFGAKGDGIAETPQGLLYVPRGIPGDVIEVDTAYGEPVIAKIVTPSPHRIAAHCALFGICGGCAMQEVDAPTYAAWKRGLVVTALKPILDETHIAPLIDAHGRGRRRVTFHARRLASGMTVGFMRAKSHDLVGVEECPVLVPELQRAPDVATRLASTLASSDKPLDIAVTATRGGLDVDLRGHGPAAPSLRKKLVEQAERLGLARLTLHGDLIIEREKAEIEMGPSRMLLPSGAFLQATEEGEAQLAKAVMTALPERGMIADLFSGLGTFALRIAERLPVHAVESEANATAALTRAMRDTQGLKPLTIETRDLFRRPLNGAELNEYEAIVIDPPRAGAEAQMGFIAKSKVPRVISVSCHLGSFVRDAEILIKGGYRLLSVTPIDQFRHSAHIELVGIFDKPVEKIKKTRRLLG